MYLAPNLPLGADILNGECNVRCLRILAAADVAPLRGDQIDVHSIATPALEHFVWRKFPACHVCVNFSKTQRKTSVAQLLHKKNGNTLTYPFQRRRPSTLGLERRRSDLRRTGIHSNSMSVDGFAPT